MPKYKGKGTLKKFVDESAINLEALQDVDIVFPLGTESPPPQVKIIGKGKGSQWQWDISDAPVFTLNNVRFVNEAVLVMGFSRAYTDKGYLYLDMKVEYV